METDSELLPETETDIPCDWFRKGLRILVAEDNQVTQFVMQIMIEKMGLECMIAADGLEALTLLRMTDYDLVLMDCQMPEMDGYETTRAIRAHPGKDQQNIPIIAITGNASAGDREKCAGAGMNGYLAKPIEPVALFQMLKDWLPPEIR